MTTWLHADAALLPDGWARRVRVSIDDAGCIEGVRADRPARAGDERLVPPVERTVDHCIQRGEDARHVCGIEDSRFMRTPEGDFFHPKLSGRAMLGFGRNDLERYTQSRGARLE